MTTLDLRAKIPNDFFPAWELNALLDGYANRPAKISSMLKKGEIIQIRRGLYTFAEPLRRGLLSDGMLANQIHGPSYVSEDYALSYYGMIPETPAVVTSITRSRSRRFDTPFGVFSYRYCRSQAYPDSPASRTPISAGAGPGTTVVAVNTSGRDYRCRGRSKQIPDRYA